MAIVVPHNMEDEWSLDEMREAAFAATQNSSAEAWLIVVGVVRKAAL